MKKLLTISLLFCITYFANAQTTKPSETFKTLIETNGITLNQPEGFVETEPVKNGGMNYEYAIIDTAKNLEIRYAVRPLAERVTAYKKWQETKKEGEIRVNPNTMAIGAFMATAMNIANEFTKPPSVKQFPTNAVKKDFNADAGYYTVVAPVKNFGKNYKFCMMIAIHKDDVADAYTFILTDDMENIKKHITPDIFNALSFK
jgi:hypothetical protein